MWGKFVHLSITFTISPTISPQYPPAEPAVAKNIPKLAKEVVVDRAMTIRRVSSAEIQSQYFPPQSAPTFPARRSSLHSIYCAAAALALELFFSCTASSMPNPSNDHHQGTSILTVDHIPMTITMTTIQPRPRLW